MNSVLEQMRGCEEAVESTDKAIAWLLSERKQGIGASDQKRSSGSKASVLSENCIKLLVTEQQTAAARALEFYADADNTLHHELENFHGKIKKGAEKNVWTAFYEKVKEVKAYHRKNPDSIAECQDVEFFRNIAHSASAEIPFSAEEGFGKRVDFHAIYQKFLNIKSYRAYREKAFREETLGRIRHERLVKLKDAADRVKKEGKANGHTEALPSEADLAVDERAPDVLPRLEFSEVDYIQWLQSVHEFEEIPRYCKYKDKSYEEYLVGLTEYLREFVDRAQPLLWVREILQQFETQFEEQWEASKVPGWAQPTCELPLYAKATDRVFKHEHQFRAHLMSKAYRKKAEGVEVMTEFELGILTQRSHLHDRNIARLEQLTLLLLGLVGEGVAETIKHCQLKQSMTADELLELEDEERREQEGDLHEGGGDMDVEESSGSESEKEKRAVYNPLKLPLGWDGKPIPYWLYKLHGLGKEFKCEICGNYSYWGRKNFEQHFSDWRHANAMRVLGIPNTSHFKDITTIVDAVNLFEKLKADAGKTQFNQDLVEVEDQQGNVHYHKQYEELKKQGLH